MSQRRVLLFDIMDTLVYNPFWREIPAYFGLTGDELLAQKDPSAWPDFELGKIDEAEYLRRYFQDRRTFDHLEFLDVVAQAYDWIDDAEPLLQQLNQQGFAIHALSNYPVWFQVIEQRLGLSRYLKWSFVSCLTGVRKPAADAFRQVATTLDCSLEDCLFIDDMPENCRAAEAEGLPSIHFVDMPQLRSELRKRGILA